MNESRTRALQKIDEAIAEMQEVPNNNVEFTFGVAMGTPCAYLSVGAITWEECDAAQKRSKAIYENLRTIMKRSGRSNSILPGDE